MNKRHVWRLGGGCLDLDHKGALHVLMVVTADGITGKGKGAHLIRPEGYDHGFSRLDAIRYKEAKVF